MRHHPSCSCRGIGTTTCSACGGTGVYQTHNFYTRNLYTSLREHECRPCGGTGKRKCPAD